MGLHYYNEHSSLKLNESFYPFVERLGTIFITEISHGVLSFKLHRPPPDSDNL